MERAKRSVEQQYAVVGVLEDFNVTLTVFEHYIPRFFRGASDVYHSNERAKPTQPPLAFRIAFVLKHRVSLASTGDMRLHKVNHNAFKPMVSEAVKDIVRRNFTREIEFYQFCRQRLYRQRLALNL